MLVATTTLRVPLPPGRNTLSWSLGGRDPYIGKGQTFKPCLFCCAFSDRRLRLRSLPARAAGCTRLGCPGSQEARLEWQMCNCVQLCCCCIVCCIVCCTAIMLHCVQSAAAALYAALCAMCCCCLLRAARHAYCNVLLLLLLTACCFATVFFVSSS